MTKRPLRTKNKMTDETQSQPEQKQTAKPTEATKAVPSSGKIAVVLVRGLVGLTQPVKDTLRMLRLTRKNQCVVVADNPVMVGMIRKVKDFVTWGSVTDATFTELVAKRGREFLGRTQDSKGKYSYKTLDVNGKKYIPTFNLNPPRKGFGRKGIKLSFTVGGALGNRGDKINDLLMRML